MKLNTKIVIGILLIIFICCQEDKKTQTQITENEGYAYLVGNEPFTRMVIQVNDSTVYTLISEKDIRNFQNKHVKITGFIINNETQQYPVFKVKEIRVTK